MLPRSIGDDEVAFIVVRCRRRRDGGGDRENEGFEGGKWMDGVSSLAAAAMMMEWRSHQGCHHEDSPTD